MSKPTKKWVAILEQTRIEVACTRHGKPSYRWAPGYYVCPPDGGKLYPAMRRREAISLCRSKGWGWRFK